MDLKVNKRNYRKGQEVDNLTRWNNISREEAKKLGLEGFYELHQMEMKETKTINEKIIEEEDDGDNK